MKTSLYRISQESIDTLKLFYPNLSVNKTISRMISHNKFLLNRIKEVEEEIKQLNQTNISIARIESNIDNLVKYCGKQDLTTNSTNSVVSTLPVKEEPPKLIYNTINDVILDQDDIDQVTKYYQDQGGIGVEENIQKSLQKAKEKIFEKNKKDQQPI